jgi:hypothetical protein
VQAFLFLLIPLLVPGGLRLRDGGAVPEKDCRLESIYMSECHNANAPKSDVARDV